MAQIRFHKRELRAALEITLIIAKIFYHLKSLGENIQITFLTVSALSLLPLADVLSPFSLDKSENEIAQAT